MTEITSNPLCWPPGWRRTDDGAIAIELRHGDLLFDDQDAALALHLTWYSHRQRLSTYARTDIYAYGVRKTYMFHRLVLGAEEVQLEMISRLNAIIALARKP